MGVPELGNADSWLELCMASSAHVWLAFHKHRKGGKDRGKEREERIKRRRGRIKVQVKATANKPIDAEGRSTREGALSLVY